MYISKLVTYFKDQVRTYLYAGNHLFPEIPLDMENVAVDNGSVVAGHYGIHDIGGVIAYELTGYPRTAGVPVYDMYFANARHADWHPGIYTRVVNIFSDQKNVALHIIICGMLQEVFFFSSFLYKGYIRRY